MLCAVSDERAGARCGGQLRVQLRGRDVDAAGPRGAHQARADAAGLHHNAGRVAHAAPQPQRGADGAERGERRHAGSARGDRALRPRHRAPLPRYRPAALPPPPVSRSAAMLGLRAPQVLLRDGALRVARVGPVDPSAAPCPPHRHA